MCIIDAFPGSDISKITEKVEEILPELHSLQVGIDTAGSIENIRSMIYDEDGLIDQYNAKYKTSVATVKAAINLVPIKDSEGNDLSAEYFKGISSGWTHLSNVMDQLGKDLAEEMVKANNAEMGSAARRIYENNVGVLTQVMIDVNSAIASRHASSDMQQTFREGVENWDWDQKSYSDLLQFYNDQKGDVDKQIEAAYKTYYDEVDDLIAANEAMLRDAEKFGLTEIGGRTIEELQSEIDELNKLRSILDENKQASIDAAKAYYESGSGYQLLRDAILEHLKKKITGRDVEQMGNSRGAVNKTAVQDYFFNGNGEFDSIVDTLEDNLNTLLETKLGGSYETIKSMIDAGILSYTDFVDESFYSAMAKRYGITGDYEAAWNAFIEQYLHPNALEEAEEKKPETYHIESPNVEVEESINPYTGATKSWLEEQMQLWFPESNADLLKRKVLKEAGQIETIISETVAASMDGSKGIKWEQDLVVNFATITPDGRKLDENEFNKYVDSLFENNKTIEDIINADKTENGGLGLYLNSYYGQNLQDMIDYAVEDAIRLHYMQEEYYGKYGNTGRFSNAHFTGRGLSVSDTGFTNKYDTNPSDPYLPSAEGYLQLRQQAHDTVNELNADNMTKAVETGATNANRDQNDILNSIQRGVEALLRKEWTVNVTPTSSWGVHNDRSGAALVKVRGL